MAADFEVAIAASDSLALRERLAALNDADDSSTNLAVYTKILAQIPDTTCVTFRFQQLSIGR